MKAMFILILLMVDFSVPARQESNLASQKQESASAPASRQVEPRLAPVAGDRLEPLADESIKRRAKKAGLPPLRSKDISEDDIEFRVWAFLGKKPLQGFVISRTDGQWEGVFLESMNQTNKPPYRRELSPKPGWEKLWRRLVDARLLTLPDSSQWKNEVTVKDGAIYVTAQLVRGVLVFVLFTALQIIAMWISFKRPFANR
jgi:hypothetical protein